jgi:predicted RNase H-like HicB family nuclease
MIYHFKVHKEQRGYWAQCIELPGCFTQGNSIKELLQNMQDALNLYFEDPGFSGLYCPQIELLKTEDTH